MSRTAFDHVALALPRLRDGLPFVVGELGGRYREGGLASDFRWRQYGFTGGGVLELLEPAGPPGGFLHRFLAARGPGVHHVTFLREDLDAAIEEARSLGFETVGRRTDDPSWSEVFVHPRSAMGIVVQMAWSGEEKGGVGESPPADEPPAGPPGIALLGLRLAAADLGRARALWCDLLGASASPRRAGLELRWTGSPMRLDVVEAGAGPEGPIAVEIDCQRPALVPRGPHPVLGTVFDPVGGEVEPSEDRPPAETYILEQP